MSMECADYLCSQPHLAKLGRGLCHLTKASGYLIIGWVK